jgi:hypothetical protein
MATKQDIIDGVNAIGTEVNRQKDIETSVANLLTQLGQKIVDLGNQLATAIANAVPQEELDALAQQVKDTGQAMKDANDKLAADVVANTPAA